MRFPLIILVAALVVLALAACSDGGEPIDDAFVPTPLPSVVTTAIATSEETAIPTTVEGSAKEVTSPEMEQPVATPRPISVQDEQSANDDTATSRTISRAVVIGESGGPSGGGRKTRRQMESGKVLEDL